MTNKSVTERNVARLFKAVYLLLLENHARFGLSAVSWSKEPGNSYVSFFSQALRKADGEPLYFPDPDGPYSLTIYESHLGVPAWGAGRQEEHPDFLKKDLRTVDILAWLGERLTIPKLVQSHAPEIAAWRRGYTVDESERYLFVWNLLGLVAAGRVRFRTLGYSQSMWGEEGAAIPAHFLAKLLNGRYADLHIIDSGRNDAIISTNGTAWIQHVGFRDLFFEHMQGKPIDEIVAETSDSIFSPHVGKQFF